MRLYLSGIINIAMRIDIPFYVSKVMRLFETGGYECFIVGGAVRSFLLCQPVHDYDLTTNALPSQMKRVLHGFHIINTGIQHGTITVMSDHHPLEITAYRKETAYSDHRHPDSVQFTSALKEDCARRDFTVNALCTDAQGNIFDFFGGKEDLQLRIIRCIGNPDERFNEDALRILRALRFAARLQFSIDPDTSDALVRNKELLRYISMERIREEMNGFLSAESCADLFGRYMDVFAVFLPELDELRSESREEMIAALLRSKAHPLVRMALIAEHFDRPEEIMRRMKFSNKETETVLNLISLKDRKTDTRTDIRLILRDLKADFDVYADYICARNENADAVEMHKIRDQIIADQECCSLKDLAVNGNDLVQAGFRGREIHEGLNLLLNEVIHERLPNQKDVLMQYILNRKQ